jgi:cytochrome c553
MSYFKQLVRRLLPMVLVTLVMGGVGAFIWATTIQAAHCGGGSQGPCTEDVFNTKHNLAVNDDILATGTTEVCVFCHTPHGGRTDVAGGGAPLWNRALPSNTGWTMYNSPNTDLPGPGLQPLGVSLACLSCHDGVIALDALINAPGSGGFQSTNRNPLTGVSPGTGLTNITFTGSGVDTDGSLKEGLRPDGQGGFLGGDNDYVNPTGSAGMEPFPNLGRDLSDDHPISIRMPSTDPQFTDALSSSVDGSIRPVRRANVLGGPQIIPGDKRDRIRLYNTSGIASVATDAVECASCHNPHTPRTTFLRLPSLVSGAATGSETPVTGTGGRDLNHEPNQGSLICLTCHQK